MTTPCAQLERTHALADGELTGPAADAARDHLATCAACQAEMAELLQLDALVAGRRPALGSRGGGVISIAWYRRRSVQLATIAVAVAAAVVVYVALPPRSAPLGGDAVAVVLAPKRSVEARLAWRGAAAYRAYDVPRAGEPPRESIALASIAALDQRGDAHGVGVLELLSGERRQAAAYLERAGDSPDVLSDRAALALGDGRPERALALADAALAGAPDHGPALWNRALALRDLGLARAAAAAFREVALRGEPGWADESRDRAGALEAQTVELERHFERINQASAAFAAGKIELTPEDARAEPGFARGVLYDAIRSAHTPERLDALAPLVAAVDEAEHDQAMARALARAKATLHPELSRQYAEIIRSLAVQQGIVAPAGDERPVPTAAARARLLAALRAAHADDLLIGVLLKTNPDPGADHYYYVNAADLPELARLTAASPDPWMQLLGLQQQAQLAIKRDDLTAAEPILLTAKQRCAEPGAPAFRCITIGRLLGELYLKWQRLPEARAALASAWASARASGEWLLQNSLLPHLATLASLSDEAEATGLPLVRAYTDEIVRRFPETAADLRCQNASWGRDLRAMLLVDRLQLAAAREELAGPACDVSSNPPPPDQVAMNLFVRAELARYGGTADEVAALRAEIARLRAASTTPATEQIVLDH
ncbi:MAG TPA: zf-HC2 domain-containing protein, partial [Kofleriaceae bacterium]|nr:zf-HC2 domain-containing protein [Kofleriaceae bacterium]